MALQFELEHASGSRDCVAAAVRCAAVNLHNTDLESSCAATRHSALRPRRATTDRALRRPSIASQKFSSISLQLPLLNASPLTFAEKAFMRSRGADVFHSSTGRGQAGTSGFGAMSLPGSAGLMLRRQAGSAGCTPLTMCVNNFQRALAALVAAAAMHSSQSLTQSHRYSSSVSDEVVGFLKGDESVRAMANSRMKPLLAIVTKASIMLGDAHILTAQSTIQAHTALSSRLKWKSESRQLSAGEITIRKLLAGGFAGAVSKTVVAPLERLTTIMMADGAGQGFRASMIKMYKDGGFLGLYSGNAATLAKIFPQTAIQFSAFHTLKDVVATRAGTMPPQQLNNLEHLAIGSIAGLLACSATYPLDTMRTQMSITGGLKGSLFEVGSQIVSKQGVGALYKGFGATLTSDVLGSGLGFMNYEIGTKIYMDMNEGRTPSAVEKGLIGALSATATLTLIMPLEVVRRRLQVQGSCGRPVLYKNTLDAFVKIYKSGGVGAFYGAAISNYLKVAPSIGSVYLLYDVFCDKLGVKPPPPPAQKQ